MRTLGREELVAMDNKLLDIIYSVVGDSSRWKISLIAVADYLRADGGMLIHCPPPSSNQPATQLLARLSEEPAAIFQKHYVWNPWTYALAKVPFGKAASANSLVDPSIIRKTAFYADVLAPWDHADTLNITHKALAIGESIGGISFCLSHRDAGEAEYRVRLLDELSPHLCRAFEASLLLEARAGLQQSSAVLDLIPNAAFLLDRTGKVTRANAAAENLMRRSDGIAFDRKGNLQVISAFPSERRAMANALKCALGTAGGLSLHSSPLVRISRPSGKTPLLVLAVPLPKQSFEFSELVAPARAIVIIVDPATESRVKSTSLQAAYGLTPAEAKLALLLADGVEGTRLAISLGVSSNTVKTQLRRCFDKTGTNSQSSLARLVRMLPPDV
jgi:DNA-binding CsgD family transcriptional regulator